MIQIWFPCIHIYSAWIQVNGENEAEVSAFVNTREGFKHGGSIFAKCNCWSMLKGGFTVLTSGQAELYFQVLKILEET